MDSNVNKNILRILWFNTKSMNLYVHKTLFYGKTVKYTGENE